MSLCLSLSQLPQPPAKRSGWPWTEGPTEPPARLGDRASWPRITVATPSRNQAEYLEETIRSVLLQGYPNLEYVVMDGASTDGSVEVIEKYSSWISHWQSRPDGGQTQAIQAALEIATGDVFNWINSDDLLAPGALFHIGRALTDECDVLAGACVHFGGGGAPRPALVANLDAVGLIRKRKGCSFRQPAIWMRREQLLAAGGLDCTFQYAFDVDLTIRYLSRFPNVVYLPHELGWFREHAASKSMSQSSKFTLELALIMDKLKRDLTKDDERYWCGVMADQYRWLSVMESISLDFDQSRVRRARGVYREALRAPRRRILNRATWKTIRRCLVGKFRTEEAYRRTMRWAPERGRTLPMDER